MKILFVNNALKFYGGVETCIFNTAELFEKKGHKVVFFCMDQPDNLDTPYRKYFLPYRNPFKSLKLRQKVKLVLSQTYSLEARKKIRELLIIEKPDIVHIHTIHRGISPSIIHEIKRFRIPIVMTFHGYPLVCLNGYLFAKNQVCIKCTDGQFYNGFFNKCFGDSYCRSFLAMFESYLNIKLLKIYHGIDVFISPSKFLITQTQNMGFKRQIIYLPHFVFERKINANVPNVKREIIYFGNLFYHKGIFPLLEAVKNLDVKLKIAGDGPLRESIIRYLSTRGIKNVKLLGELHGNDLEREILTSLFTILPSLWYENCPYSILESFSLGKPVIGSKIGGIPELIEDKNRGLLVKPGDHCDLRNKIEFLLNNPDEVMRMGTEARKWAGSILDPELYYNSLINIYHETLASHGLE